MRFAKPHEDLGAAAFALIAAGGWPGAGTLARLLGELDQQIIGARELTPAESARFEAWEATS